MITAAKERITREALTLSKGDRADIATVLIDSLDDAGGEELEEKVVEALWAAEAEERVKACDEGRIKLIPLAEVKRKYAQRRRK